MAYLRTYIVIFGLTMLTSWAMFKWLPTYREIFLKEDSLIENISALFYLITFLLSLFFFFKSRKNRKLLILVSAVGLFGFLEEISYGQRLFSIKMPNIHSLEIDTIHDFFLLGYLLSKELNYTYASHLYLFTCAGIFLFMMLILIFRYKLLGKILHGNFNQAGIFALIYALLIFTALIIDLRIVPQARLFAVEEFFEMNAALALLFCSLSLRHPKNNSSYA